ncbi:hypothetical protein S7335_3529 [Synechococcus sp. PCC 7335]|nr:hypothetical protein S7335_3529 [Synechococcus sp. PCC 7335]
MHYWNYALHAFRLAVHSEFMSLDLCAFKIYSILDLDIDDLHSS